jgi:hypothetical protein
MNLSLLFLLLLLLLLNREGKRPYKHDQEHEHK